MNESFQQALRAEDLELVRTFKADLHSHGRDGDDPLSAERIIGRKFRPLDRKLFSMEEMHAWARENLNFDPTLEPQMLEGAFARGVWDGLAGLRTWLQRLEYYRSWLRGKGYGPFFGARMRSRSRMDPTTWYLAPLQNRRYPTLDGAVSVSGFLSYYRPFRRRTGATDREIQAALSSRESEWTPPLRRMSASGAMPILCGGQSQSLNSTRCSEE
jgi:hypothetical protein